MERDIKRFIVVMNCIVWVAISPEWVYMAIVREPNLVGLIVAIAITTFITFPLALYIATKLVDKIK